jgi:alpha-acetolactate decarboxylase
MMNWIDEEPSCLQKEDAAAMNKRKCLIHYLRGALLILFVSCWSSWAAASDSFDIRVFGNFERMSQTGDTQGAVKLQDILTAPGSYGLGALADLRGEILLWDGKLLISRGHSPNGSLEPAAATDEAVFFVEARVETWDEVAVPNDMSRAEFERFVLETAARRGLSTEHAFPFALRGSFQHVLWHVVTGTPGAQHEGGHAAAVHAQGHAQNRVFDQFKVSGFLLGFHSGTALEGVVSHPGERFHIHYADTGFSASGHVDDYRVDGGTLLLLPRR